jgi:cell volume regulation protein A
LPDYQTPWPDDFVELTSFFAVLGGLLVLAFIANRLVRFTRVPDVIILMATGVVIGPSLHWVNPDVFRSSARGFGSLALILILFEGGLDLKLKEIVSHFGRGLFLALISFVASMSAIAAACRYILYFSWINSLLIGAVLGCISSSILLPVLQQVNLRREVKVTLLVEASLGDALGVLAVTTLLDIASGGSASPGKLAWALVSSVILAVACGILAGMLWSYFLPVLSEQRFWHVLTFAAVLLLDAGVHYLKGNELVSVLVFGVTLSNFPAVRRRLHMDAEMLNDWFSESPMRTAKLGASPDEFHQDQMLTFHGELAFLLRTFFFVLLGMLVDFIGLRKNLRLALLCFSAILAARFMIVQGGRVGWRSFSALERELMVWFVPRGLITAVLGIEVVGARGPEFSFLPSLAFAVIVITNVALLVGSFRARNLPLVEPEPGPA